MKIIEGEQADCLRSRFIDAFIDQEGEVYTQSISKPFACSDGMCYLGYLWDALKDPVLISEMEILCRLSLQDRFYAMWDIHSKDYIYIPDYWKYPKKSVLLVTADEFGSIQHTLPEDIYLFDDSFCWTYVLTHEDLNGARFCLSFRE